MEEKRRFPRIKTQMPMRYQIRGTSVFNTATADDISRGGMSFINDYFIAPATTLMLEVNLLAQVLSPIGRIAWSSPLPHSDRYRIGVEFTDLDQRQKNYLDDYVDMQLGKI